MTESQPSPPEPATPPKHGLSWLKGCGCVTGLLVMVLGILIIGQFDATSWAAALTAAVVGVLVYVFSGVNGMWER